MDKLKLILLFLILVAGFSSALAVLPATGYVVDNANILTIQEKAEITSMIVNIQKNTTNEIAVLIIPNLEDETIETYAEKVFNTWKIGKKQKIMDY